MNAQNVIAYTFSSTSNTQKENKNVIFTSEKLKKSDELADTLQYLIINNDEYYVSNSVTANAAKGDHAKQSKDSYLH